jgi:hypothetical protein
MIYLILCIVFAVACDIYDVTMTEKGIKAEVGVEANDWLVGSKPSAVALYLRDCVIISLTATPAAVAFAYHDSIGYGLLAAPVVAGVKHILGGLAWKKLL